MRRQFLQRIEGLDQTFDRLLAAFDAGRISSSTYERLADGFSQLSERAGAHINSVQHLRSEMSLTSFDRVSEVILRDMRAWIAQVEAALVASPDAVIPGETFLVPGAAPPPDRPAWVYFVVGAGVVGLAGFLAFNIWRRTR